MRAGSIGSDRSLRDRRPGDNTPAQRRRPAGPQCFGEHGCRPISGCVAYCKVTLEPFNKLSSQ